MRDPGTQEPAPAHRFDGLLALVLGVLLSTAFAPFRVFPLAVVCLVGLFLMWERATPRRAAWLGFAFGSGTFLAGTYWLYISVHVFGQAPLWVAIFLMLSLVVIMGAYHALVGYIAARWLPPHGFIRWLIAVPALWVTIEWLRGWVLSGFPWLSLGYSQIDFWLASYAPLVGVYGVSVLVVMSAGAVVSALREHGGARLVGLAVLAAVWAGGWWLSQLEWTRRAGEPLTVSLVQGAISQDLKWQAENRDTTLKLYRELTRQALGSRIIVWPEAALPALAHEVEDFLKERYREARAKGSDLIVGVLRYDFTHKQYRNSILAMSDELTWYDKRRLVPFGEYFPVPPFVRSWMKLMSLPYVDMTAGAPEQPPLRAGGEKLGATICYEDAYGSQQLKVLEEATLLVNVSNDAWFGNSTAPHQHLEIARMRALEDGRMLLRATNDGITAIIGADGRVLEQMPQFKPGVLTAVVQPRTGLTPYARTGNVPVISLCLLGVLIGLAAARAPRAEVKPRRGRIEPTIS
ncbi:MAG TPA: apolipoprotein N-acyltransferase [Steroidobacteraceae bacterium]|nr:apolipoprotein N-acyltransferase [Steroidobacteraceae bacterium]